MSKATKTFSAFCKEIYLTHYETKVADFLSFTTFKLLYILGNRHSKNEYGATNEYISWCSACFFIISINSSKSIVPSPFTSYSITRFKTSSSIIIYNYQKIHISFKLSFKFSSHAPSDYYSVDQSLSQTLPI